MGLILILLLSVLMCDDVTTGTALWLLSPSQKTEYMEAKTYDQLCAQYDSITQQIADVEEHIASYTMPACGV